MNYRHPERDRHSDRPSLLARVLMIVLIGIVAISLLCLTLSPLFH